MNSSPHPKPSDGRIRVVTMIDFLNATSGAERLALHVAVRLDPERFDSTLCASRWPAPLYPGSEEAAARALKLLEDANVRFFPLRHTRKVEVAPWVRLARFLRHERVQVLHSHKFGSNVWASLIGTIARVPVIVAHEHTWSYEGQPVRRFLDRQLIARGADRFVAVSREDRRKMTDIEQIPAERTMFIPIGILPPRAPDDRDMRAELGIGPDVPVIGVVGLMRPQKALPVLLHAVARVRPQWPDMQVVLVGDGSERAMLEALTNELGLGSNVRFLGLRADVADVLRAFDIAVCSSDFEGSPAAILEYMDAELPVVSTSVGGIPDMIESGVHGLLVPAADPAALADAIGTLLREPERARAMGRRGRERRRSEFEFDVMVGRLEALYIELLEKHEGGVRT
jgi:glycosyltransferase involved in cell wall biosynthesis